MSDVSIHEPEQERAVYEKHHTGAGNSVSGVSLVFPSLETGFAAYLCGIRQSVSVFPVFPVYSGGVLDAIS